jgi:hypothetical protein
MLRVSIVALAACTLLTAACTTATDDSEEESAVGETSDAYTGRLATLEPTSRPRGAPESWNQPDSEGVLGQNGYCGATAAANLLRWYGREVSPRQAINDGCWSYIGTRPSTLAAYLRNKHPDLDCRYGTMAWNADALQNLKNALAGGRPVVIEFMTGGLNAHWVTVIGVRGEGANTSLVVESWGGYYTVKWNDIQDAWRRAWGGYYPYIMCQGQTAHANVLSQ